MKKIIAGALIAVTSVTAVGHVEAATKFANCAALNRVYPHGVGYRKGLVNKGGKTVAYRVDKATYLANKSKDRDKDFIACER
jgi:hypothetical protein